VRGPAAPRAEAAALTKKLRTKVMAAQGGASRARGRRSPPAPAPPRPRTPAPPRPRPGAGCCKQIKRLRARELLKRPRAVAGRCHWPGLPEVEEFGTEAAVTEWSLRLPDWDDRFPFRAEWLQMAQAERDALIAEFARRQAPALPPAARAPGRRVGRFPLSRGLPREEGTRGGSLSRDGHAMVTRWSRGGHAGR
jgi:hypothetical protein